MSMKQTFTGGEVEPEITSPSFPLLGSRFTWLRGTVPPTATWNRPAK